MATCVATLAKRTEAFGAVVRVALQQQRELDELKERAGNTASVVRATAMRAEALLRQVGG